MFQIQNVDGDLRNYIFTNLFISLNEKFPHSRSPNFKLRAFQRFRRPHLFFYTLFYTQKFTHNLYHRVVTSVASFWLYLALVKSESSSLTLGTSVASFWLCLTLVMSASSSWLWLTLVISVTSPWLCFTLMKKCDPLLTLTYPSDECGLLLTLTLSSPWPPELHMEDKREDWMCRDLERTLQIHGQDRNGS